MTEQEAKPVIEFDHTSDTYAADPRGFYRDARTRCPVAWTEAHGGYWVTSRYQEVFTVARDDATYSSRKGLFDGVECQGIGIPPAGIPLTPIETDPPELRGYRLAMNPFFGPAVVDATAPLLRQLTTWCIDQVIERGEIDFVDDLASPLPAMATMALVGLPLTDWRVYADVYHGFAAFPLGSPEYEAALAGTHQVITQMYDEIADRRRAPRDDLVTRMVEVEIEGRKLNDDELVGILNTTLGGGIDTTTALIAQALAYLDEHPEHRAALATDEELMGSFCEEMLRYASPVQGFGRTVTHETELGGQHLAPGDRVFISWAAANWDPKAFERPDEVIIDRFPNRHMSFGVGVHRCIGSYFARTEFADRDRRGAPPARRLHAHAGCDPLRADRDGQRLPPPARHLHARSSSRRRAARILRLIVLDLLEFFRGRGDSGR